MMNLGALAVAIRVEGMKLRRSLVVALGFAAPALIGAFTLANVVRAERAIPWIEWLSGAMTIWAFFLLPLSVTALCVLLANLEHLTRSWDHLRALASPRWALYTAKAVVAATVTLAMSASAVLFTLTAVTIGASLNPDAEPTGPLPALAVAASLLRLVGAATLLIVVQLWIALRFASFVPALVAGIGGTFFAVVAPNADIGELSPWQLPLHSLSTDPERASLALVLGLGAGCIATVAMVAHLSRREVV